MSQHYPFRHLRGSVYVAEISGRTYPAMGTLPDGTMCSYCDAHEAHYIPDGCCGPLCGPCMDIGIEHGFDHVYVFRLQRWIRAKFWPLSPRAPMRTQTLAESVLHDPLVAIHISQYMIWVTDEFESWNIGDAYVSAPCGVEYDDTDQLPR